MTSITNSRKFSQPTLTFVSIKAFGDLTITVSSLRRLPEDIRSRCALLLGPHLIELYDVLATEVAVETLEIPVGIPALFDIKKQGLLAGLRSAPPLRRALAKKISDSRLVFDRLTFRERFISGQYEAIGLPDAPNVYAAYQRLLLETFSGVSLLPEHKLHEKAKSIGIFPISRIASKSIPSHLVEQIARQCIKRGFEPTVVLLEGEHLDSTSNVLRKQIARNFGSLAKAVDGFDAVISADSFPAHLAAYFAHPVFVASPVINSYWLPATTFEQGHWGLFTRPDELAASLDDFLKQFITSNKI